MPQKEWKSSETLSSTAMSQNNWYIFKTASRAEKKIAERLDFFGFEHYLPLYVEKHKWHDRYKLITIPLFKGHIFVKCHPIQLRIISLVQGVVGPITDPVSKIPATISDNEIEEIKKFLRLTDEYKILSEGDIQKIFKKPIPKESSTVSRYKNRYMYIHIKELEIAMYADTFKRIL